MREFMSLTKALADAKRLQQVLALDPSEICRRQCRP